ncbi:GNAT family N-acetyltransferase [Candidatus Oscillochloris fontis]|uniref:GNAT family N-acetyltransferase n=1 Tax=Candidatus Oscillochloris fontis TaxID=2496868 RepID=UPI00101B7AEB|nr:GNAT family N-acetyltransferase [Candidatus Oscillochloris fontis]
MPTTVITLRPATSTDVEVLAVLLVQLYHVEAPGVLHGPLEEQQRFFQHLIGYELASGSTGRYIALDPNGKIVGTLGLRQPGCTFVMLLPPGTLRMALNTIGLADTLRLIFNGLRNACAPEITLAPGEFYLYSLVVDETMRYRGIGAKMLSTIETIARQLGGHTLLLRVLTNNTSALQLYQRMGYQMVAHTPSFLEQIAIPSAVMRKVLG